jgi:hypothetical protein
MKLKFTAHLMLIDCGKASKMTHGVMFAPFSEGGSPPYNHWG